MLKACLQNGSADDWERLIARLQPLVAGVVVSTARKLGLAEPGTVDDLVQEVFLKLLKQERASLSRLLSDETALFRFVKAVAANAVYDHAKRVMAGKRDRNREVALEDTEPACSGSPGPNLVGIDIERVFRSEQVSARDQAVFWLYFRHGYSAKEIANMPFALGTKGVESCLLRLVSLLRARLSRGAAIGRAGKRM